MSSVVLLPSKFSLKQNWEGMWWGLGGLWAGRFLTHLPNSKARTSPISQVSQNAYFAPKHQISNHQSAISGLEILTSWFFSPWIQWNKLGNNSGTELSGCLEWSHSVMITAFQGHQCRVGSLRGYGCLKMGSLVPEWADSSSLMQLILQQIPTKCLSLC